jgi:hypothetical protein
MAKSKPPMDINTRKKLHEEWSELVTGSKDGMEFDPDDPVFKTDAKLPPITHAFGKNGYEIHVRSSVFYASYSYLDKKEKIQKETEIPLFSEKSKSLSFPYKFKVRNEDREFTEQEYREILAMLHKPKSKRRNSSS